MSIPIKMQTDQPFTGSLLPGQVLEGTQGKDKISPCEVTGGAIYTGAGIDTVDLSGTGDIFKLAMGADDDVAKVSYNDAKEVKLFGDEGDDKITFGGTGNDAVTVGMLDGNNTTIFDKTVQDNKNVKVYIGTGSNHFYQRKGSEGNSVEFAGQSGSDEGYTYSYLKGNNNIYQGFLGDSRAFVRVGGDNNQFTDLTLGAQDDRFKVSGDNNTGNVFLGQGKDKVTIDGQNNEMTFTTDSEDKIVLKGKRWQVDDSKSSDGTRVFFNEAGNIITVKGDAKVTNLSGKEITETGTSPTDRTYTLSGQNDAIPTLTDKNDHVIVTGSGLSGTLKGAGGTDSYFIGGNRNTLTVDADPDETVTLEGKDGDWEKGSQENGKTLYTKGKNEITITGTTHIAYAEDPPAA